MSNERPDKAPQRFSRYSRRGIEDLAGSRGQPDTPSMSEITTRALQAMHEPGLRSEPVRGGWDQPPPPEPGPFWSEEERNAAPPHQQMAIAELRAKEALSEPARDLAPPFQPETKPFAEVVKPVQPITEWRGWDASSAQQDPALPPQPEAKPSAAGVLPGQPITDWRGLDALSEPSRGPALPPRPEAKPSPAAMKPVPPIIDWRMREALSESARQPVVSPQAEAMPSPAVAMPMQPAPIEAPLEPSPAPIAAENPAPARMATPAGIEPEPIIEFDTAPPLAEQPVANGPSLFAKSAANAANAATMAREAAIPALTKAGLWVAQNLRRGEIRKRYNRLLVFGHTRIADRKVEELFFVPSRKAEVIEPAPQHGIHYDGPVAASAFRWIMAMVPDDLRQFAFVDIRAGRGRTSLLASGYNFNRILAHEWDPQIFDDLEMNVAQYPRSRMTCRKITCHRGDRDGIALPDQPCVIWFSGAWREELIRGVMDYARDTYRQSPRRIYVVLENVAEDTVIPQDTIFDQIEPAMAERLKLKLLSPVEFKVYRSSY